MIIVIDNYDSFTYNLVQYLEELGESVKVFRNDQTTVAQIEALQPDGIVISPGPGRPESAGISPELLKHFAGRRPILGVCLGHQVIGAAFGARIIPSGKLMHGKTSSITADGQSIYHGIASPFQAMCYHSLVVSRDNLPECLTISAQSEDGKIMGLRHRQFKVEGVQFHPESIMTPVGKRLLRNFLKIAQGIL